MMVYNSPTKMATAREDSLIHWNREGSEQVIRLSEGSICACTKINNPPTTTSISLGYRDMRFLQVE
jgi:hypothetical protein